MFFSPTPTPRASRRAFSFFSAALTFAGTCAFVCAALVAPQAVHAQVTSYSSLAAFNAAATTNRLFTFEGIAPSGDITRNPNLTPLAVSVSGGIDPDPQIVDSAFSNGTYTVNGTDGLLAGLNGGGSIATATLNLGSSMTAFGTEIASRGFTNTPPNFSLTIRLFNASNQVGSAYSSGSFNTAFIGFTSSQAFDRVVITPTQQSDSYIAFDNTRLATASAPEPGSVSLLGMALASGAGIIGTRRFRCRQKSA